MKKLLSLLVICLIYNLKMQAQFLLDNKVELTGVVMSADSLRYLPFVAVEVFNKDYGTVSNDRGVFSLIVDKGDTLVFNSLGYRKKTYVIPRQLSSNRYSVIQLMTQDTFYLSNTIIRPQLSREEFDIAFKTWNIPDDRYELARKNTEFQIMRMLSLNLPRSGSENQSTYQRMMVDRTYWAGQQPPMTIFNPLAWYEFYKAWKRGDFKRKRK